MSSLLKLFCRLLLSISSTIWIILIYIFKERNNNGLYKIVKNMIHYEIKENLMFIVGLILLLILITIILAEISIFTIRWLEHDNLIGPYKSINDINSSYLAGYLGYFFVALSINDTGTLMLIYMLILIIAYRTLDQYYNPVFILLGYRFYIINTKNNIKILIITKRYIRSNETEDFKNLRRINNGCYFEEAEK